MKPTETRSDTTKVAVLGVGLVVIVLLLIMQVQNFNAPQSAPPLTIESPKPVASTEPAQPDGFESIVPPSGPGVENADPFRPVLFKRGQEVGRVSTPTVEKLTPPKEIAGLRPGMAEPGKTPGVAIERPALPKLTGVLLGDRPLAVFEMGGKSQMASVGERLPGGFQIVAITEKTVQLVFGKELITLKLGE